MPQFCDVNKVRAGILESIEQLISVRHAAEKFATDPNAENGEDLVSYMDKFASSHEGLKMELAVMVKQAGNNREDDGGMIVTARDTENGVLLS